jgi:hypothetical protein
MLRNPAFRFTCPNPEKQFVLNFLPLPPEFLINFNSLIKKRKMKHIVKSLYALCIAGVLFSCNNASDNKKEETTGAMTDSTAMNTTTAPPAPAAPTLPMDVAIIYHKVKDYNAWRPVFDADSTRQKEAGLTEIAVERSADQPNNVKIVFGASDIAKAKAFSSDPQLKEAMDKAGVISKPEIMYWKIIRYNPENQKPNDQRVEIVHKVKNFDAWLKGFDAEGPATRAANGLNDLALGVGIDDPNLVHIVFEVTDMAKAKARMADPALKKIMQDAGVVGVPTITFYNDASK